MIQRHWRGIAKSEKANNYIQHLLTETFPQLRKINGFKSASILKKETQNGIEFLVITVWESLENIKKFAGEEVEIAVVPQVVKDLMLSYDEFVTHYEVASSYNPFGN